MANIPITTTQLLSQAPEPRIRSPRLPVALGVEYNTDLQRIVMMVKNDIDRYLIPILEAEQANYTRDNTWFDRIQVVLDMIRSRLNTPVFRALVEETARSFVNRVDARTQRSFGVDIYGNDEALQTAISASIFDNTRLITSIPEQYLSQVESIVVTNTRAGIRSSAIATQLFERFDVTRNRARFIARDQTAKVNSAVAQKRIESAGYEYFQWVTSEDARVRDRHDVISDRVTAYGKGIYRFDNPPLSASGQPILPGVDYQCRCIMRPVPRREVERNQANGLTRPGVLR